MGTTSTQCLSSLLALTAMVTPATATVVSTVVPMEPTAAETATATAMAVPTHTLAPIPATDTATQAMAMAAMVPMAATAPTVVPTPATATATHTVPAMATHTKRFAFWMANQAGSCDEVTGVCL